MNEKAYEPEVEIISPGVPNKAEIDSKMLPATLELPTAFPAPPDPGFFERVEYAILSLLKVLILLIVAPFLVLIAGLVFWLVIESFKKMFS